MAVNGKYQAAESFQEPRMVMRSSNEPQRGRTEATKASALIEPLRMADGKWESKRRRGTHA
jgi:hypothetical protein